MNFKKLAALFVAALLLGIANILPAQAAELPGPPAAAILISEVQTGGSENANQEFVELYNRSAETIDVTGWRLEYKSATGATWTTKSTLAGAIESSHFYVAATAAYLVQSSDGVLTSGLAASGGHIRLVSLDTANSVIDTVGWGTADSPEGNQPAPAAQPGQSVQRCFADNNMLDTDVSLADFRVYLTITPKTGLDCALPQPPDDEPDTQIHTCEGVRLSEVLPNPAGADGSNEFIELFNATNEAIPLEGCGLQTSNSSAIYLFDADTVLDPGTYRALYSSETTLTLPNAAGGTVYLLGADSHEADTATYPAGMADDTAWAWFDANGWQTTYAPSPNATNVLQADKPCAEGQTRNEETGRCASVTPESSGSTSALTPCRTNQERNPETSRCRNIITTVAAPAPCSAGQERNPATNRCRAVAAAATTLKPCAQGQERNPETNRCHKVAATSKNPIAVRDIATATKSSMLGWWLAGIIALLALGYAIYEWKQEIRLAIKNLHKRMSSQRQKADRP